MPAVINVLQFCEFWWGCRVRKNKKWDRLDKMFSLEKKCRVDQNALTKYWFCTSPGFFLFLEKVSILSTFIAPFKYLSPGATTMEDEDNLSKQCFFFIVRWIIKFLKMKALPRRGNCGKEADMQILAGHKSSPHVKCKIPWCSVQICYPVSSEGRINVSLPFQFSLCRLWHGGAVNDVSEIWRENYLQKGDVDTQVYRTVELLFLSCLCYCILVTCFSDSP